MLPGDTVPEKPQEPPEKKGFGPYFWDKVFVPLLLVLVSGFLIFGFQERSKREQKKRDDEISHEQKIRDEAISSAKVNTEILVKQRVVLMEAVGAYLHLLEDIGDEGIPTAEESSEMHKLRKNIEVAIKTIYPMSKNIKEEAAPFIKAIRKPLIELTQKRSREEITTMSNDILTNYLNFLEKLKRTTMSKVREEIEKAEKELCNK
jgi:hypothetical protein